MKKTLVAAALLSSVCPPMAAAVPALTGVTVSSDAAKIDHGSAVEFRFGAPPGGPGRAQAGVGVGIKEGKPLEVLVWGGGGAILGGMAGPAGAVIGGAAGAAAGLLYSVLVEPHTRPRPSENVLRERRPRG